MDVFTIFLLVAALIMVWTFRGIIFVLAVAMFGFIATAVGVAIYFLCNLVGSFVSWLKRLRD